MSGPTGDEWKEELRRFEGPEGAIRDLAAGWPEAVGTEIARNAWPARVKGDGTLVVHVRDSIWGFELTQRAGEISQRLPGSPRLEFVPGPVPDAGPEAPSAEPEYRLQATLEQTREAAELAAPIEDAALRDAVARAARASLARAAEGTAADRSF
ncbi:MAG TPA: DUF721 domain-containing protein [Gaiellaceae bacterium]|nr:DUF721 domain-containing protein [Gaiellaceae bacterium]